MSLILLLFASIIVSGHAAVESELPKKIVCHIEKVDKHHRMLLINFIDGTTGSATVEVINEHTIFEYDANFEYQKPKTQYTQPGILSSTFFAPHLVGGTLGKPSLALLVFEINYSGFRSNNPSISGRLHGVDESGTVLTTYNLVECQ